MRRKRIAQPRDHRAAAAVWHSDRLVYLDSLLGGLMMEDRETVKIYSFRIFDSAIGGSRHANYKASREMIASLLGGELLEGTEQEVAPGELDELGRYRRVATGWGELS